MADYKRAKGWLCAVASAAALAVSPVIVPTASAQDAGTPSPLSEAWSVDLRTAPEIPAVPRPAGLVTNRPTMPMADYLAAKNAATARQNPGRTRTSAATPPSAPGVTLFTQVAANNEAQTTGGNQFPPDGDIATSDEWMVQVVNDIVTMYNWNDNSFKQVSLNTLLSGSSFFIFAPRVIHDPYWDRFIVLAVGCKPCSGSGINSRIFIAVSQTGDPSGQWWLIGAAQNGNPFLDFPQLGMDLDAIIATFNVFRNNAFSESELWTFDKAHLYNGKGGLVGLFSGGSCTMAPPYVLDRSGIDYVLQFCPGDTKVIIGSLTNSSRNNAHLNLSDNTVDVDFHGVPPDARQAGVIYPLDTGDNRFENRSLQVGGRIINTATIDGGGFPLPAYYNFNIGASPHTLMSDGVFFASDTSFDWHPSIVANTVARPSGSVLGEVFVTWMSTDPNHNVNLQLRAGGWIGDDPGGTATNGIPVFTSPLPLTNQTDASGIHRSGDYTSVTTYPAAALGCQADEVGILTGEAAAATAGLWSTRVGIVKHC